MALEERLRRAAAGDREARDALVRAHYDRVREHVHRELSRDFRQSHRWVLPLFSTGDIVQEVFHAVLRDLARCTFQDERDFERLLTTLVRNRILDAVRHHASARRDARRADGTPAAADPADPGADPAATAALRERIAIFADVLQGMPEREGRLIEARLVRELPWDAVALELDYPSPDAARKAFAGARARLLVRLGARGLGGEGSQA